LFTTLAQAFIASTDFWNRPGCTGVSTSAMTATWISLGVMPTSSAFGAACAPAPTIVEPSSATTTASVTSRGRESRMFPPGTRTETIAGFSIQYFLRPESIPTCSSLYQSVQGISRYGPETTGNGPRGDEGVAPGMSDEFRAAADRALQGNLEKEGAKLERQG